jgi:hypothetical protein
MQKSENRTTGEMLDENGQCTQKRTPKCGQQQAMRIARRDAQRCAAAVLDVHMHSDLRKLSHVTGHSPHGALMASDAAARDIEIKSKRGLVFELLVKRRAAVEQRWMGQRSDYDGVACTQQ